MLSVLKAGKAEGAVPIARTEMVIAYSPKSQFAADLAKAGQADAKPWWKILQTSGFRFGRTDPNTDPQGINIIFTMKLAASYYHQPELAKKILGPDINAQQIFNEPEVMARLQSGQLDASSAYKTQPAALGLPFIELPKEINLGDAEMASEYKKVGVEMKGKLQHPQPLVFYAAVLKDAPQPKLAEQFVAWLQTGDARSILSHYHYDDPGDAAPTQALISDCKSAEAGRRRRQHNFRSMSGRATDRLPGSDILKGEASEKSKAKRKPGAFRRERPG